MAFNFSKIVIPCTAVQLKLPLWDGTQPKPALSALVEARRNSQALSIHSPAS
jgi:hypothetical protein